METKDRAYNFQYPNGKSQNGHTHLSRMMNGHAMNYKILDKKLRVLIYSQDGFGLGHLRRNLNITNQVKKICPSASVLIVADSPVAPFFELPPQCDFIKIPTIIKINHGEWKPNRLSMNSAELLPVRSAMIESAALSFRPDFILVDHMPQGALGELDEPIKTIKQHLPKSKLVLGLRDILGAPQDIEKQWKKENAYKIAEEYYDKILVYGSPDMYETPVEYNFSEALLEKVQYCGYVCQGYAKNPLSNRRLQGLIPPNGTPLILVTGGGGHDASRFMDAFLDAVRQLKNHVPFRAVISTGPFMTQGQIRTLRQKSNGLPVRVAALGKDAIHFMLRSDLLISMAGYNTTSELMRFRKNAIIIPRPGPSAEQTIRSNIFRDRELAASIHLNDLTADSLANTIAERLRSGVSIREEMLPDLRGAYNAAYSILTT